jgi:hypothetical protein
VSDDGYPGPPDGPVRYERVYRGNTVIGYLWWAPAGRGFVPRPDAGRAGAIADGEWRRRLRAAHARENAVDDWRRHPDDTAGALNDTDEWEAATLAELVRLAAEPEREERHRKGRGRAPADELGAGQRGPEPSFYVRDTDGPVSYAPAVAGDGTVLGYLWAAEGDDAAGFVERAAAGTVNASNAASAWHQRLRRAYDRGLPALRALREWVGEDPAAGHDPDVAEPLAAASPEWRLAGALPPSSERHAGGLAELRRLAGDPRADL